jgi:hypothetical protein
MSAAPDPLTREEDDDDLPAAIDTRPFFIETRSGIRPRKGELRGLGQRRRLFDGEDRHLVVVDRCCFA